MARKDHLITIQEEEKSTKQSFKRNNAILFQAVTPTIANEINGIGATSKTPDEVKDTKFPILNPIDPIGKNTDGTINIDLSLENSPFTFIELSDVGATVAAITINFLNLVKNKAERFILDITKDPGNVSTPTVTFVPTVENLPAGFPDNDPRYLLEIVARETPTETRFEVVNRSGGSGTIPAGTIENQHLEWDNTATDWLAVQSSTYGATGPFADTGFLRFANDNIMLSQRNAGDTGNLEFKVSTLDEFDFTNSSNALVDLVLRAQDAVNPDAKFIIRQNQDDGASGDITTFTAPQSILFNVNTSILMTIGPTVVDVQADLDMNLGNILSVTQIQGRDDGTTFVISFNAQGANDTRITDDAVDGDRINIVNNGENSYLFTEDTGRTPNMNFFGPPAGVESVVGCSNGVFEAASRVVPVDGVVNNDAILFYADTATDPVRLLFKRKTVAGVVSTGTFVYSPLDFTFDLSDESITNANAYGFQDSGGLIQGAAVAPHMNFVLTGASLFRWTTNATNVLDLDSTNLTLLGPLDLIIQTNSDLWFDGGTTTRITYDGTSMDYRVATAGSFRWFISATQEMSLGATNFTLAGVNLDMSGNNAINFDFMEFNERVGDPTVGANAGVLYVKDVSTNSHLFFDNNTEAPVDLTLGGGVSFPITPTVDVRGTVTVNQAVDISQADGHVTTMTLGAASITVTFSGFPASGTQQTWELHVSQDATGGRTLVVSPTPVESFTIAQGANKLTILTFLTNDGGTDIHVIPSLRGTISLSANQTPWLQNIDADGFSLQDLNDLEFRDDVTKPATTVTYLSKGTTDFFYNVPTGDLHNFTVAGVSQMTINVTTIDFQGNSVIDGILGVTITGISGITGLGTQGQNLIMGNFNITGISDLIFTEAGTQIQATVGGILIQVPDTTDKIDLDVNGRIVSIRDGFVDISTNSLDVTERAAPAATTNQAKLYSKDVATVTHMFVIDSAGVETDLTTGAGANQQLSNLVATVAVNLSLVGTTDGIENLGTASLRWGIAFVDSIDIQDDLASNPPESGVTEIEADQGGMNLGVAATDDAFDYFFGGVTKYRFQEDKIEFTGVGRAHEILLNTSAIVINAELATDTVEISNKPRAFPIAEFDDFLLKLNTKSVTDTSPYELIFNFRNNAPEGLTDPNIGNITWEGLNSVDALKTYVQIQAGIDDATATSEDGFFEVFVAVNGTISKILDMDASAGAKRIGFYGVAPVVRNTGWSNNEAVNKTITTTSSANAVREAVGTIIDTLINIGILST